jgi:hypothetical protein
MTVAAPATALDGDGGMAAMTLEADAGRLGNHHDARAWTENVDKEQSLFQ